MLYRCVLYGDFESPQRVGGGKPPHQEEMYAEDRLKAEIIAEAIAKSGDAICPQGDGYQSRITLCHFYLASLQHLQGQRRLLSLSTHARR
jgi:hypothetical protein